MPQTLLDLVKKIEGENGTRAGVTTNMALKMKALERENRFVRLMRSAQGKRIFEVRVVRSCAAYPHAAATFLNLFIPLMSGTNGEENRCKEYTH